MSTKQTTLVHVNEDYIDMELITCSSPQHREFEFQMSSISNGKDSTTSPADDLFYKGKLLPLHLPPRLQMVQNLLQNSNVTNVKSESLLEKSTFPFTTKNAITPLESCNISPSESCRVSSEVNPDEYLFGWSSSSSEKSWPKKLKQIKQFWLGQKLKASKTYLKSLFNKSGCSNNSCASATSNNVGSEKKPRCKECQNKYLKIKKNQLDISDNVNNTKHQISYDVIVEEFITHRKSFSGVGQRHCAKKCSSLSTSSSGSSSSSSSFSLSSSSYYDMQLFKRSISANSELESSVEGAIAHCKKSQMQKCSSKNVQDGSMICSQFVSKIAVSGNQEMASLANTRG
ncbi:hypothetical protein TanjilG_32709 [Lupinus angustifolius]|uniref:probable membrane-associated kinase regulator 4 n=1 Tax=Lupinus angustifolius TaxID=3871 RepID=UPI00090DC278|nr:PREDICTED: probable membrane-associated kinase regulator 4 [Lupinus angustifolius]OIV90492.1 hypothetical protein TanjilG_32709 [Lupinus angustifolius]